jgi:hypothetical protein
MVSRKGECVNRVKRGLLLGGICAVVAALTLLLFRDNIAVGAGIAALLVILVYFVAGRFFSPPP